MQGVNERRSPSPGPLYRRHADRESRRSQPARGRDLAGLILRLRSPEWALLARGLQREYLDEDGRMVSNNTDETTLRAIWRHYLSVMER